MDRDMRINTGKTMMTELILFGSVFLVAFTGIIIASRIIDKNKRKNKPNATVTFNDGSINVQWSGHTIDFTFKNIDGFLHYAGAKCNEVYSCSITSSSDGLPWRLWAKCGNDEITIATDLKSKYEII